MMTNLQLKMGYRQIKDRLKVKTQLYAIKETEVKILYHVWHGEGKSMSFKRFHDHI